MKKAVHNPFSSGGPVQGEFFGDRVRETRDLVCYLLDRQNVFLISPRRYGKTSLLLRAREQARTQGAKIAYANLQWATSKQEVAEEITRSVIEGVAGKGKARMGAISDVLGHLPGARVSLSGGGSDGEISVSLAAPAGGDRSFLQEIKAPVSELSRQAKGAPVALIIDEFQRAAEIDRNLPAIFKAVSDELGGVSLIFAGSSRHMMENIFRGAGAPLKGAAQEMSIDVIPAPDMTAFLMARTASSEKKMLSEAAERIYDLARGVPNATQLLAKYSWWSADEVIDEVAVTCGLADLLRDQGGSFLSAMGQFSSNERRCVRALAGRSWTRPFSQDFVGHAGIGATSIKYAIETLGRLEYVLRNERGEYRIEDPIFDLWLQHGPSLEQK